MRSWAIWKAVALAVLLASPARGQQTRVELVKGLQVVAVVNRPDQGDYESIKDISGLNEEGVDVGFMADLPNGKRNQGRRQVLRQDLNDARQYAFTFESGEQGISRPGTTALGTSRAVLTELQGSGTAQFGVWAPGRDGKGEYLFQGVLERVGVESFDVLLNQRPARLPVIHARGRFKGGDWWTSLFGIDAEFWFVNDPDNPLCVRFRFGSGQLHVTGIAFPSEKRAVEHDLDSAGHTRIYGIYFDFGSERIRPQSQAVLAEIAEALERQPRWRLRIEGHTDNIGSDADNLRLSQRRAEAVKRALTERLQIAASRLSTSGHGPARPVATNDTIQGRALNRRVELVRE